MTKQIPVTIVTGYLGSGKTTLITNLVKGLPKDYQVVWLKNEYGDVNIDKVLASGSNVKTAEMLNGCLCCVLVGKLGAALDEIMQNYAPDRIIIETSGTAYPAPIVWEVGQKNQLYVDGVITVIDALNFRGFTDKGKVAELESKYTDLFVINKTDLVNPEDLEDKLDDLFELNPQTAKVYTKTGKVDKDLLIGLDHKLRDLPSKREILVKQHAHDDEVEVIELFVEKEIDEQKLLSALAKFNPNDVYRVKGIVKLTDSKHYLLNGVAGKFTLQKLADEQVAGQRPVILLMGRDLARREALLKSKLIEALA